MIGRDNNNDDDNDFVWKDLNPKRDSNENSNAVRAADSANGSRGRKRKAPDTKTPLTKLDIVPPSKKARRDPNIQTMRGLRWSARTQSCAYDSLLSILSNVYYLNAREWNKRMSGVGTLLEGLAGKWCKVLTEASFDHAEQARDCLQRDLNREDSSSFPNDGYQWTDMASLLVKLLEDESGRRFHYQRRCGACGGTSKIRMKSPVWFLPVSKANGSLHADIKRRLDRVSEFPCPRCGSMAMAETVSLNHEDPPPFIAFGLEDRRHLGEGVCMPKIPASVSIGDKEQKTTYKVRGLIYWNKSHFTCRLLGKGGHTYFNDGRTTGTSCIHEGKVQDIADQHSIGEYQLTYILLSLL